MRGERFLWLPVLPEIGNAALLLALVLDGAGWPDASTATGRIIGVTRETVRAWRDLLLAAGMVAVDGSRLVATEAAGKAAVRFAPLPRRLIAGRGDRPTPAVLRACAAVLADGVGWRADRHGCRADRERAAAAGVSRAVVREARRVLVERDLVELERLRRGRAGLVRARLVLDANGKPAAAHGRPIGDERRTAMAEAAERGRRGAKNPTRRGAKKTTSPMQRTTFSVPHQDADVVSGNASRPDGCPDRGDVLATILAEAERTAAKPQRATDRERIRADLARLQPARLLAMPKQRAVLELLRLAGVFDKNPKRQHAFAVRVAQAFEPAGLLVQVLDIVLGKAANAPAVLRHRIERRLAGENGAALVTRCRADWTLGRFIDELRAAAPGETLRAAAFSPNVEARAATDERALITFAQAGDWRMVRFTLGRGIARERNWTPAWLAERSGVAEATIAAGLAGLAQRATA